MKRIILLTISLVTIISLSACSQLPSKYQPIQNKRNAYLNSHATPKLTIPSHHPKWQFSPRYVVPSLSQQVKQSSTIKPDSLKPPYLQTSS